MLERVEAYAAAPLPALPRTDRQHIAQFGRLMSDMPRQGTDTATGAIKLDNQVRHLGHLPRACLDWMAGQVHARFTFYPSIKELLELSKEWTRDDASIRARVLAKHRAAKERQARVSDMRRRLRMERVPQQDLDALSEGAAKILETEGLLHRCDDCGSFAQRGYWREWQAFASSEPPQSMTDLLNSLSFEDERDEAEAA